MRKPHVPALRAHVQYHLSLSAHACVIMPLTMFSISHPSLYFTNVIFMQINQLFASFLRQAVGVDVCSVHVTRSIGHMINGGCSLYG
ncbi:hypothetical protein TNCV_1172481 [Trichonephila clavipes]|uniref:Uncharacterized protein n=1 Tax=Trichonephila clavipes TaxID=2585209 RepID=A0A8X6V8J2_TRICX|nr:hypothetical protein TNCV_1172481 [Trichonephila clavipes]